MAEITVAQLDNIKKVTGVDAFCVFRTMDAKKMDAKQALLNYKKYYKKFEQEGLLDNKQKYLDEITKEMQKDKLKLASVLQKHAEHIINLQDEMASRDPVEYMMSTVHEVNTNMPFASHNASDFGKSLAREMDHKVYADLDDLGLEKLAASGEVDKDVMDVLMNMHELDEDGKPVMINGIPQRVKLDENNSVHQIARVIQDAEDYRFDLLNENGANIQYRANRGVGQWLRADMLQSVPLDEVIEDFRKWLHPDSFKFRDDISPEEARKKQYSVIKKIIENHIEIEDGLLKEVVSKEGLNDDFLKKYEGQRQLKYKDSESVMQAMNKYGSGKLLSNVSNSAYSTAKMTGLMSRFGADPDLGYSMLRKHVLRRYGDKVPGLHEKMYSADHAYRHARGLMTRVGTSTKHDIATGIMAHTRVVKYGAIGLSALKDIIPSIFALRSLTGRNSLVTASKLFGQWFDNIGVGDVVPNYIRDKFGTGPAAKEATRKASAQRAGLVLETHLNRLLRRYAEENGDPRALNARMAKRFGDSTAGKAGQWATNKLVNQAPEGIQDFSRINAVTDANRTTFTDALALEFADMSGQKWDDLYEGTQRGFKRAGISAEDWEILRKLPTKDTFGLNVETIAVAPDKYFPDRATRERLHKAMKMLYYDWANTASPTGGLREDKIFGIASLDPNSTVHNVLRIISVGMRTPIKAGSATLKILYNQMGVNDMGELIKADGFYREALHMASYAMVATYFIEQLRNYLSGRDFDDPQDYNTWLAMLQSSGALGIYGDILLSQSNKYASDPSRSIIGPGFGTIDDIIKTGASALGDIGEGEISTTTKKGLIKQIPFNNWYISPLIKKTLIEEAAGI